MIHIPAFSSFDVNARITLSASGDISQEREDTRSIVPRWPFRAVRFELGSTLNSTCCT